MQPTRPPEDEPSTAAVGWGQRSRGVGCDGRRGLRSGAGPGGVGGRLYGDMAFSISGVEALMSRYFPSRTYTFIDADGTVYNEAGQVISPPALPVYVPDPQTDPVGHRMDLALAALIREIRTETGTPGDEAYATAYRRMFELGPDDDPPVPALSELPWRKDGQHRLDRLAGRRRGRTDAPRDRRPLEGESAPGLGL